MGRARVRARAVRPGCWRCKSRAGRRRAGRRRPPRTGAGRSGADLAAAARHELRERLPQRGPQEAEHRLRAQGRGARCGCVGASAAVGPSACGAAAMARSAGLPSLAISQAAAIRRRARSGGNSGVSQGTVSSHGVSQRDRPARNPASGPAWPASASVTTGVPKAAYRSRWRLALTSRGPTWGCSRSSACSANGTPWNGCRPLSCPPMRVPWPPASTSPVMRVASSMRQPPM